MKQLEARKLTRREVIYKVEWMQEVIEYGYDGRRYFKKVTKVFENKEEAMKYAKKIGIRARVYKNNQRLKLYPFVELGKEYKEKNYI